MESFVKCSTITKEELKRRTKQFAHRCVKLAMSLPDHPLANHIRYQLIRCGTPVAANYRAACIAHSKVSFTAKLSIVIEEADESAFWLEFIMDEELMRQELIKPLFDEANELTAIFISSRKTIQTSKWSIINHK